MSRARFIRADTHVEGGLSASGADPDRRMQQEVERAGQLFSLASQEALVQGRPVGVVLAPQSYRFLLAGADVWELQENGVLRPREIPHEWRIEWEEGDDIQALDEPTQESAEMKPQAIFYSTGEADPFSLIWRDHQGVARYRLSVSPVGEVGIETAEDHL